MQIRRTTMNEAARLYALYRLMKDPDPVLRSKPMMQNYSKCLNLSCQYKKYSVEDGKYAFTMCPKCGSTDVHQGGCELDCNETMSTEYLEVCDD
jgi:hypothetical protein